MADEAGARGRLAVGVARRSWRAGFLDTEGESSRRKVTLPGQQPARLARKPASRHARDPTFVLEFDQNGA